MKGIFHNFFKNLSKCFWGKSLFWHLLAITLTFLLAISRLDWLYYKITRFDFLRSFFFPAVVFGGILPILIPLVILIYTAIRKNSQIKNVAPTLTQSAIIGVILSSFYKSITGRFHPMQVIVIDPVDITRKFDFGLFTNGIFWGWPSSHTTIAFAMAMSFIMLYPKNKIIRILAIAYAFYVGIGVSMTIHWFSDFVAGAIFGSIIGIVVGKSFREINNLKYNKLN